MNEQPAQDPDRRRPMGQNERGDDYTRRTGYYPPHWTADQCRVQDARLEDARRAGNTDYLKRWGAEHDGN